MSKYDWRLVAHTVNGYDLAGGFRSCAETLFHVVSTPNDGRPLSTLSTDTLRIALFFAARADRHRGFTPDECPEEEAILAEIVRRLGEETLDAELSRLSAATRE